MALRPASSLADWERSMRPQDLELAKTHPSYGQRLTDQVFSELCERGFAIVPNYLPEAQRADMAEALRNILPPLDELLEQQQDVPGQMNTMFPYAEHALNHAISNDPEALAFSARWLGTDEIHYRPGLGMSRYPLDPGLAMEPEPEGWADARTGAHIDNGNNSLLPPTMDRRHSQIIFWFILEDTAADQAPTIVWPTTMTPGGPVADMDSPVAFTGKGGSLCLFHNYTMHAASAYRRADGQRFIWKHAWGRADYCWEGTAHYTNQGHNTHWREFISQITPRQRELFRLPAAGHDYYTSETLVELEKLYPGFDSSGAYSAALHSRQKLGDRNGPLPWGASAARL